ncbi:hypothetical protein GYMLUDRAFT_192303 [Collybiopsis luxurians FD-317 M1]|nr:hypothetical protein GYMLUDRAFT_192303 [Collybiopsis luxurians FD-317 M1]
MTKVSPLCPIDPAVVEDPSTAEKEKENSWIKRQIASSLTGRIIRSSYESLKATGNSVTCLSPWGDQSPLILPCLRFRDLAIESVLAATGGTASIASPMMGNMNDAFVPSAIPGPNIAVEQIYSIGFDIADDLITGDPVDRAIDATKVNEWRGRLETTSAKELRITLKYKIGMSDAAVGFYKSSVHPDSNLFTKTKEYLDSEKAWFSPYLFASNRRPIIPRLVHPDFVFCHGPFLQGDYRVGENLLNESASIISFCGSVIPTTSEEEPGDTKEDETRDRTQSKLNAFASKLTHPRKRANDSQSSRARAPVSGEPAPPEFPPDPRRIVILAVGIKPFRKFWTSCARPGESVINYILLNGCPAIVVPVKTGSPLLAWNTLTLEHLHKINPSGTDFDGLMDAFYEFLDLCVDWDRVKLEKEKEEDQREALKEVLRAFLEALIKTKECQEALKTIDPQRTGIAMWRIS